MRTPCSSRWRWKYAADLARRTGDPRRPACASPASRPGPSCARWRAASTPMNPPPITPTWPLAALEHARRARSSPRSCGSSRAPAQRPRRRAGGEHQPLELDPLAAGERDRVAAEVDARSPRCPAAARRRAPATTPPGACRPRRGRLLAAQVLLGQRRPVVGRVRLAGDRSASIRRRPAPGTPGRPSRRRVRRRRSRSRYRIGPRPLSRLRARLPAERAQRDRRQHRRHGQEYPDVGQPHA